MGSKPTATALLATHASTAREDNRTSDNYVLFTVLFAAVLFFAGICRKLRSPRVGVGLLSAGVVFYLGTLAALAAQPVEFF